MKAFRARSGPFREQLYFTDEDFESLCLDELQKMDLLPAAPEPIRIERFAEKRFGIVPAYDELPNGLLGFTKFGPKGVEEIVISRALSDDGCKVAERRLNSTLAHECGHGLLHAHLFMMEHRSQDIQMFRDSLDNKDQKVLCRTHYIEGSEDVEKKISYDGRWWEYQANRMIGTLLLPRTLVFKAIESRFDQQGALGLKRLNSQRRVEAERDLVDIFDVNPVVARIRLDQLFPRVSDRQLTL